MLGGKGYYRGSTILVRGTAGTGKTSLAAHFAHETGRRGERCLYLAFEESPQQLMRNMRSIGIDLEPHVEEGPAAGCTRPAPRCTAWRCTWCRSTRWCREFEPAAVVIDPISNFIAPRPRSRPSRCCCG